MSGTTSQENLRDHIAEQKTSKPDKVGENEKPPSGCEPRDRNGYHPTSPGKDCCQASEAVITIESESMHSSDTELSTYVTCCSECDHSRQTDDAHDKNNNKSTNSRKANNIDKSSGGKENHPSSRKGRTGELNEDGKVHEAMNYQVKTNPKSGKKIEGEEMRIKITETKENIKAITTIHLIHTPDQTSEVEGNVSRKKRLFMQNKRPNETGSGNKYRKLFYELPETSTDTHYAEEEFTYEPRFRTTTTKLVMKARSLINLNDDENEDPGENIQEKTFGTGSSGSFKENLQRYKSEPDLDALLNGRSREKRIMLGDDIQFSYDKTEANINKTRGVENENATHQAKDKDLNILKNATDRDLSEANKQSTFSNKEVDSLNRGECWITGATFKNHKEVKAENFLWSTCPRRDRFCFYYPRKRNREIIDDELPDPDMVKDIRNKFEQTIKTKTENLSQTVTQASKPPLGNRQNKHQFNTWSPAYHTYPTVEITQTKEVKNCPSKLSNSPKFKHWSDTTSISSGVASDFSYETDSESSPRAETIDVFQIRSESDSGQPVSADTLKKIRACGTTTTYYGGRMISYDKGTVRSPMTMTIMDEIRQNIKENEVNLQLGIKSLQNKYSGMKFKLVKSNSCGSRLELSGTNSREWSKKQTQPPRQENTSTKLESVSENGLSHSCLERRSKTNNTAAYVSSDEPTGMTNAVGDRLTCDSTQIENYESPEEQPSQNVQDTNNHADYNSICLIENGETQGGVDAENKERTTFLRLKGQSTKDIVKAFESVSAQKEEVPTAPWKSLVESRKQANRMAEMKRAPVFEEMEFEEFQVLDESAQNMSQSSNPVIIEQNS